jgi:hypothetical protein
MKKLIALLSLIVFFSVSSLAYAANTTNHNYTMTAACVRSAMEKREESVKKAFDDYSATVSAALETRLAELEAAWNNEELKDISSL